MILLILTLPEFTTSEGVACSMCHVNPSGASLRTETGEGYQQIFLPIRNTDPENVRKFYILNRFAYGGDFRLFLMKLPGNTDPTMVPMQTDVYGMVFIDDHVQLLMDISLLGSIHEVSILWNDILYRNVYARLGYFYPNFGLRYEDHTYYVMDYLDDGTLNLYLRNPSRSGFELGYAHEHFNISLSYHANQDLLFYTGKGDVYANFMYANKPNGISYMFGASLAYILSTGSYNASVSLGLGLASRFSITATYLRYNNAWNVMTAVVRMIPTRGIHILASLDYSDEFDNLMRFGGGLSIFPVFYAEFALRAYYNRRDNSYVFASALHFSF